MELRHFRYFIAVAEESSLGRAAHRLHVSQPALSQQISDLEDELGLKLFTRNSRGVELTEAGRVFLIGGRRVLVAAKEAAERAQEAAKGERGRLVIGSLGAATVSFLSGVLSRFREEHPLVEISLSQMNNRAQVEAVLNGSIMLGIGLLQLRARRGRTGAGIHSIATSFACCNRSPEKSTATKRSSSKAERLSSREILIRRPGICIWVRAMVAWILQTTRPDLNQKLLP